MIDAQEEIFDKPLRVCKFCGLTAYDTEDLSKFKIHSASKYQRENLCLGCYNQIQTEIRDKKRVLVLSPDLLRSNPIIDKALNTISIPYVRRDIRNMFSETGVLVFNYRFVAQAYKSAFILHVSKVIEHKGEKGDSKPLNVTFSIRDLLDQTWRTNKRLPRRMKRVLDIIYEEFIQDKIENFMLALSHGLNLNKPLEYQQFRVNDFVISNKVVKIFCNLMREFC